MHGSSTIRRLVKTKIRSRQATYVLLHSSSRRTSSPVSSVVSCLCRMGCFRSVMGSLLGTDCSCLAIGHAYSRYQTYSSHTSKIKYFEQIKDINIYCGRFSCRAGMFGHRTFCPPAYHIAAILTRAWAKFDILGKHIVRCHLPLRRDGFIPSAYRAACTWPSPISAVAYQKKTRRNSPNNVRAHCGHLEESCLHEKR